MSISSINPHLEELDVDYLYHLGLDSSMDLQGMFGDVKYVCMGGSAARAEAFANKTAEELGVPIPEEGLKPIGKTERFSLFKVGPVISVSHGMGMPSMKILLDEITKLMHYAKAKDFSFIRIGTSGGVGVEAGEVVIANEGLNEKFEPYYETIINRETHRFPATVDSALAQKIYDARGDIKACLGKILGSDEFYEGQMRLDGAYAPPYSTEDKMQWLQDLHGEGGRAIEMEADAFFAHCARGKIPAANVCVALLNRLEGDQVRSTSEELAGFSNNSQTIVINFIRTELEKVTNK